MKYAFVLAYALGLAGYAAAVPTSSEGLGVGEYNFAKREGLTPCRTEEDCEEGQECFPTDRYNFCRVPADYDAIDAEDEASEEKRSVGDKVKRNWLSKCSEDDDCIGLQVCRISVLHPNTQRCRVGLPDKRDVGESPEKRSTVNSVEKRGTFLSRCDSDDDCNEGQECRRSIWPFVTNRCRIDWV